MSTPGSTRSASRPPLPLSPYGTISLSHRDSSPRAASLARLTQSPVLAPQHRSGTSTPAVGKDTQSTPLLSEYFRKIGPKEGGTHGSLSPKPGTSALSQQDWNRPEEDPEVIRRHLVSAFDLASRATSPPLTPRDLDRNTPRADEEFNSLRLLGGDVTRQVYRFAEQSAQDSSSRQRSRSFSYPDRSETREYPETVQGIMAPGGFRRNFLQRTYLQPDDQPPTFLARNFLHFLTLYGHFAGEDLEEWDEPIVSGVLHCITKADGR
jgi:hypothetical protein